MNIKFGRIVVFNHKGIVMYQQPNFKEDRIDVMHDLIREHSLATLVTVENGELSANHIPFLLKSDLSENGVLQGHISKGNPLWKNYNADISVLAIFQGPQHYISPSWYPSKTIHQKVVPTWNYAVVHAHGALKIIEDKEWLYTHLSELTRKNETGRTLPWQVTDAPEDYIQKQLKGIVGIEISINRLEGKWKMSQNKNVADKEGVVKGLRMEDGDNAQKMAELIG